jgi:hypothetical protein
MIAITIDKRCRKDGRCLESRARVVEDVDERPHKLVLV